VITYFKYRAPIFHIDFMKPSGGRSGRCSMDFFKVDPENIDVDVFFGPELEKVKKAMALVDKYQRTVEEGRGKMTKYLEPFETSCRMELQELEADDEKVRQKYYQAVVTAYKIVSTAYMKRLHILKSEQDYALYNETKTREFVQFLYNNDLAVKMGKELFKEHFRKYWAKGFWNIEREIK
jgi:hypothetical protein